MPTAGQAAGLVWLCLTLTLPLCIGLKHDLTVQEDARYSIELERFGFGNGGHLSLAFTDILVR